MKRYILEKKDEPGIFLQYVTAYPTEVFITQDIEKAGIFYDIEFAEEMLDDAKAELKDYKISTVEVHVTLLKI